jgi:probable F420-dependent oxidoreductase
MRFALGLPTDRVRQGEEFVSGDAVSQISRAAESAGFGAVFVTEHTFPEDEWMRTGGHHALDPFVALSFAAAATTSLRVLTNLCVVPYRNPFLTAKAVTSLDVLSGGRLILGVGAGYLEPEFTALGVDFSERNELFDEGLTAMKRAWAEDGMRMEGRHFTVAGHTMLPRPVQQPHPPIWVGGNSRRAIRRAVELGDGWMPMPNPRSLGARRRSAPLETVNELAGLLSYAREHADVVGRTAPLDIMAIPFVPLSGAGGDARLRDQIHALEAMGVTWLAIGLSGERRPQLVDAIGRFGDEVIAPSTEE